jgi:hypothetical protein
MKYAIPSNESPIYFALNHDIQDAAQSTVCLDACMRIIDKQEHDDVLAQATGLIGIANGHLTEALHLLSSIPSNKTHQAMQRATAVALDIPQLTTEPLLSMCKVPQELRSK